MLNRRRLLRMPVPSAGTEPEQGKSSVGLSESGDRPELVGGKQPDQVPELPSPQLDLAAVVVDECDWPSSGPSRLIMISQRLRGTAVDG